jgi:ligand-binding sensor domain-containing protein
VNENLNLHKNLLPFYVMPTVFFLRLLSLALACMLFTTIQAQYYFDKLTEENGLSDNRVTSFLKDKTGFLWVGTRNGLNRYDGNTFKVFRPAAGNSISSEEITDIIQDATGKIWVSTLNGLNTYDQQKNRWETLLPTGRKDGLPNAIIWDLHVDEQDQIWIVSDVWELSVYDPATKKFRYFDWPSCKRQPQFDSFPRYRSIQKIVRKNENEYWLGTTIGLFSVNKQTGIFRFYGARFSASIKDLQYDTENQTAYLVTERGRVFCYDERNNQYSELKMTSQPYPAVHWTKNRNERESLQLAHPAGMLEVNKRSKEATIILHQPTLTSTLLPGGTNVLYADKQGMLWAGTNKGISYYNRHNKAADFISLSVASDKENTDGMSAAVYDDKTGQYFVSSLSTKAVFIIDRRSGAISTIKTIEGKALPACTNICI